MVAPEIKINAGQTTGTPSVINTNGGLSQAQNYTNSFAQQSLMGGDDTFAGIGPMGGSAFLNMGGSVFDGEAMGGSSYGGSGYGYGTQVRDGVMTSKEYMRNELDKRRMQIDAQFDEQVYLKKRTGSAQFEATAADDAFTRQCTILQDLITNNKQDLILPAYNKLCTLGEKQLVEEHVLTNGQKIPTEQLKAHVEKAYAERMGMSLLDQIDKNCNSSFTQGLELGTGIGIPFADKNNRDTIKDAITIQQNTGKRQGLQLQAQQQLL